MKQVFDLKKIDQLGSIFKDMKLLYYMRVTEIINKDDCLIFEYENNDLNDSLFIEYNLDRFKKIIIKYNYNEINITDQFVFVHHLRRAKCDVFRINEFINFIKKKKIKLYWVDYFLSTSEIYLEFIDKFGWDGYIRFDLQLKTIEYEWIEK